MAGPESVGFASILVPISTFDTPAPPFVARRVSLRESPAGPRGANMSDLCSTSWPKFSLVNYQSRQETYQTSFGLDDLPPADATIVGLYFAD